MSRRWRLIVCLTAALLLVASLGRAQHLPRTDDWVYDPRVYSVQCFRGENELAYPVLYLDEVAQLHLEFDLVGTSRVEDLSYMLIQCDAEWRPSSLNVLEYFDGFAYDRLLAVTPALTTRIEYVHYRTSFPAQGGRFKLSGNYLIVIHDAQDESRVLLVRRFLVAERVATLTPQLGFSPNVAERFRLQQVAFTLAPGNLPLFDPLRELKVKVLQNFRWDVARTLERPTYIYPTYYEYAFSAANDFPGGNEFRTFDARSLRRLGFNVESADCRDTCAVRLSPDRPRATNAYLSNPDLNGAFVTGLIPQDTRFGVFESDYILARFTLHTDPLPRGQVFITGAFTNWHTLPRAAMRYDAHARCYRADLLVKQGVYNYQYVLLHDLGTPADEAALEGSHVETENAYTLLVYYRRLGDRTDRLVGIRHVNYYE